MVIPRETCPPNAEPATRNIANSNVALTKFFILFSVMSVSISLGPMRARHTQGYTQNRLTSHSLAKRGTVENEANTVDGPSCPTVPGSL